MPYIQGVSEVLSRKIRAAGVTVHLKPINTIRSMLGTPKDKPEKLDKSGVVYNIQCEDCPSKYVGETERSLAKRLTEHKRASSPVGSHMTDRGHKFDPKNVKILDSDPRWLQRGIKEAIHIATQGSDLNRDQGRYKLPRAYHRLLSSCGLSKSSNNSSSHMPQN